MISQKRFTPSIVDGSLTRFLSDFIITTEQHVRVYNYVYDPINGSDVSDIPDPGGSGLFIRETDNPTSSDLIGLDKWDLVTNSILFYVAPHTTSTLVLEVATSPEEFGGTLIQPTVERAEEAAAAAEASEDAALISENNAAADAVATAADRVQTGLDEVATNADAVATAADRVQTGLDEVATNADAISTAADRVQTGLDAVATAADRVQTGLDEVATNADAVATAADRVQTGLDEVATNADAIATAADRVQTGLDEVATNADAIATAADRVQTGLDEVATNADAIATAADKVATNADVVLTNADVVTADASKVAAGVSETNAAVSEVDAEDSNLEAASWADEDEDIPVKEYTSGTPSDISPTVYSAKHYSAKAQGIVPAITGSDNGKYLQVDDTGNPVYSHMRSFKNHIINGGFDVWQRGTSFTFGNGFTADRWEVINPGGTVVTATKHSYDLGTALAYGLKLDYTGNTAPYSALSYKIEDVRTLKSSTTYTLSLVAEQTVGTTFEIVGRHNFGVGGGTQITVVLGTIPITSTRGKGSLTFTTEDTTGTATGANSFYQIEIRPTAGSNIAIMTEVQLEEGIVATAFETRPIAMERVLCQRYFVTWGRDFLDNAGLNIVVGTRFSTNLTAGSLPIQTRMRVFPTLTSTGTYTIRDGASATAAATATGIAGNTENMVTILFTSILGPDATHAHTVGANVGDGLTLDAEL